MRRSLSIISLLVVLSVLLTAAPAAARSPIALGASDPNRTVDEHIATLAPYDPAYKPRLWSLWSNWGSRDGQRDCAQVPDPRPGNCAFPTAQVQKLFDMGITPVIWWQPTNPLRPDIGYYSRYRNIATGVHDKYIKQWAVAARNISRANGGKPIVVRFAHEATGAWFPWSIGRFDNNRTNYKQAWNRLHKLFSQTKARPYVRFVWSNYFPRKAAYPGDKVVDYVGVTVLNFGNYGKRWKKIWKPMASIVARQVRAAKKITRKPIMLSEVASYHGGGNKAAWLRQGYLKTFAKYPNIKAILYLDTHPIGQGHPDWRLIWPQNGTALAAYAALAKSPKFKGSIPRKR